ncbi:MAG: aminopeptidase [Bacteroidetes bacterium B1(2017)]|nr:MAG: aminopeptidase [Bacteroidetes bacterium B1(2017)]
MKNVFFAIFSLFSITLFAQDFAYQSTANPYYWKNRKPYEGYWQQDVNYLIKATLDDSTDIVTGSEVLTYSNNSNDTLKVLYFHLYQNAFIKGGYLEQLNLANGFKQKFGKYEAAGKGTEILSVQIDRREVKTSIDFSIMKIELEHPILPHTNEIIYISFKTYFDDGGDQRRRMKMFKDAAGNKQYDVVHWYPRICVYDRKFGWETDQHLGKEFYGDFGEFTVSLTLPNNYIMDATGELENESEVLPAPLREKLDIKNFAKKPWDEKASTIIEANGTTKTWLYHSVNTHDFAWTCDPTYRLGEVVLNLPENPRGKVRCIALVQEPHASGWQDAAWFNSKIIETYSKEFGTYAYPKMIVADARDGMEYPMLTLDGGSSPGYYGLFAHEIGHNWFFGMVGNNETYRASLDEGFTQFLTHWSMSRLTKEQTKMKSKSAWVNKYYKPMPSLDQTVYYGYLRDAINHNDMPINTHSDDFNGALNHGGGYGHVYYKTATMLYNLQYVLGEDLFKAAMQNYFNQWKMAHPYFEDFRNSIINYTHVDLNWFFDQWMETTKTIDYGVKKVKKVDDKSIAITFERKGEMQMPLDFILLSKDSSIDRYTLPNTYFSKTGYGTSLPRWLGWGSLNKNHTVVFPYSKKLSDVQIDPTHRLADINELNNSWKCPVLFTFDHQVTSPADRRHYLLKARPDLWYNSYDGFKVGVHVNGNYLNLKHVFKFTAWYNTGVASNYSTEIYSKSSAIYPVHYSLSYKNRVAKFTDVFVQSRILDGLFMNKLGVEKTSNQNTYRLYVKTMRRVQLYYLPGFQKTDIDYQAFVPNISSYDQWNNTLNLEWERGFNYLKGNSKLLLSLKTSSIYSDFDYAGITAQITQTHPIHKLELRTRLYASYITGSHIAQESQLYLAGANPEEMVENKFNRAAGIVPSDWSVYGNDINKFQMGGGINLRGYSGYLAPVVVGANQYYVYRGNQGASVNIELDYDKYINLRMGALSKYIHLDAYLFFDAGILAATTGSNLDKSLAAQTDKLNTGVMACGGHGLIFTIKRWGVLDEIKPLSIRFDIPFYLSNASYSNPGNIQYRWVLGVNRSF